MQLPVENRFCSSVKGQDRSLDIYQVKCWSFLCCVVTKRGKAIMQISFQLLKRSMDKLPLWGLKMGRLMQQQSKYLSKFLKLPLIIVKFSQKTLHIQIQLNSEYSGFINLPTLQQLRNPFWSVWIEFVFEYFIFKTYIISTEIKKVFYSFIMNMYVLTVYRLNPQAII